MQLVAEGLCRRLELGVAARAGVLREDRGAGEAKDVISLELPRDEGVHVAELRAVALVEDEDHLLLGDGFHLLLIGLVFQHRCQFLYRCDDEFLLRVAACQLSAQDVGAGVAVGSTFLEAVILFHRLVVQVFAVDDKDHLVDEVELCGQPCRLEGGQRLARARGVPDISARLEAAFPMIVVGDDDAVDDLLRSADLIRAHDHQQLFAGEDTVFGDDVEEGVLGKEGLGEIHQVGDGHVLLVSPPRRELKGVAGVPALSRLLLAAVLPDMGKAGGVAVVFRLGAVGDDKDLHVLEEAGATPERLALVAVDLVEGLADGHAPPLQLHVDEWETIDEDGHIVTVVPRPALGGVLVDDLQAVVVDILPVKDAEVFLLAVVEEKGLHVVLLDEPRLLHDAVVLVGKDGGIEALPLRVGKGDVVERFHLPAQVADEFLLGVQRQILVGLVLQQSDKGFLQRGLALVLRLCPRLSLVVGDDGRLGVFYNYFVGGSCGEDGEDGEDGVDGGCGVDGDFFTPFAPFTP